MGNEQCVNCRFWTADGREGDGKDAEWVGQCQRHPPRIVLEQLPMLHRDRSFDFGTEEVDDEEMRSHAQHGVWPQTHGSDWCGEYKTA